MLTAPCFTSKLSQAWTPVKAARLSENSPPSGRCESHRASSVTPTSVQEWTYIHCAMSCPTNLPKEALGRRNPMVQQPESKRVCYKLVGEQTPMVGIPQSSPKRKHHLNPKASTTAAAHCQLHSSLHEPPNGLCNPSSVNSVT